MQDFNRYNFTINENELVRVLKDAQKNGYPPLVIINGEYYNVQFNREEKGEHNEHHKMR